MWWRACCLGYSLLQKFRTTRLISDAKVVHILARSLQSILFPQGSLEGKPKWSLNRARSALNQGVQLFFFQWPSSSSNDPLSVKYNIENTTLLLAFSDMLIIASHGNQNGNKRLNQLTYTPYCNPRAHPPTSSPLLHSYIFPSTGSR